VHSLNQIVKQLYTAKKKGCWEANSIAVQIERANDIILLLRPLHSFNYHGKDSHAHDPMLIQNV